jgi:hypothetical protein
MQKTGSAEAVNAVWAAAALTLLLTGCAPGGNWARPGADTNDTAIALQQCRAAADRAVGPEEGIDQDILATRQTDWQRTQIGGLAAGQLGEETRARADEIVAGCMLAKGFALAK